MRLIKRELGGQGGGVVIKRGRWNIHNSLFDHLREDVNKWKYGKWVDIFPKNWYCTHPRTPQPLPTIRLGSIKSKKYKLHF